MATKKTTPKKAPAKKKPAAKKAAPVKVNLTERTVKTLEAIAKLQNNGYTVKLICKGREKTCQDRECLRAYVENNIPFELVGMKSGTAAVCVPV